MKEGVAWAPRLPDAWGHARLRWLSTIYAGGTPDRDNPEFWQDGTIPWLNSGAVNDWAITEPSELISAAGLAGSSARWVPAHSVVIGLAGQGRTKGTAARLEFESTTNQSMAAIVPGPGLSYRYLHYWLVSNYQSIRNLAGGDKRDGLNLQHLGSIECPLPPILTQDLVANFLDRETARIDTLIAKQEQLIATLRERRIAMITDTALGGFDPIGPTNSGPGMGVHFEVTLGKMLDAKKEPAEDDIRLPYVRAANIQDSGLDLDDVNHMWFTPRDVDRLDLQKDDLLVVEGGAVGTSVLLRKAMPGWSFQKTVNRVRARTDTSTAWLAYVMRSYRDTGIIDLICDGSTIAHLTAEKLRVLRIPDLPPEVQRQQADYLDAQTAKIDTLITKAGRFIELSKERRAALITAAVTGAMEIPGP